MLSVSTTDCLSQGEKQSQQHNSEERHVDSHHHHHLNAFFKGIYRAQKLVPSNCFSSGRSMVSGPSAWLSAMFPSAVR